MTCSALHSNWELHQGQLHNKFNNYHTTFINKEYHLMIMCVKKDETYKKTPQMFSTKYIIQSKQRTYFDRKSDPKPLLLTLPKLQYCSSYKDTQHFLENIRTKYWTWLPRTIPSNNDHSLVRISMWITLLRKIFKIRCRGTEGPEGNTITCRHKIKKIHILSKLLKMCQYERISTKLTFPIHLSILAGLLSCML